MADAKHLDEELQDQAVIAWRAECLTRAGVDRPTAYAIAEHEEVDLHEAVELAKSGCPADLLLPILL